MSFEDKTIVVTGAAAIGFREVTSLLDSKS